MFDLKRVSPLGLRKPKKMARYKTEGNQEDSYIGRIVPNHRVSAYDDLIK
jgi:hypothetical protein